MFYASVVVFELKTMEMIEAVTASGRIDFPYISGLLCCRGYRLPEPVRQAHKLVKKTATGKE